MPAYAFDPAKTPCENFAALPPAAKVALLTPLLCSHTDLRALLRGLERAAASYTAAAHRDAGAALLARDHVDALAFVRGTTQYLAGRRCPASAA